MTVPAIEVLESEDGDSVVINGSGPFPLSPRISDAEREVAVHYEKAGDEFLRALESVAVEAVPTETIGAISIFGVPTLVAIEMTIRLGLPEHALQGAVSFGNEPYPEGSKRVLEVHLDVSLTRWALPVTHSSFLHMIGSSAQESGIWSCVVDHYDHYMPDFLVLVWQDPALHFEKVADAMRWAINETEGLIDRTYERVFPEVSKYHALEAFTFPVEVRSVCEQYLVYFAEFLREIGVRATSSVVHDGEKSILQVEPADGPEALSLIHQALADYLSLVDSPTSAGMMGGSIAEMQLTAQVQHLQSQLSLAAALVQAQNATIELKDATIARLKSSSETQGRIALAMSEEAWKDRSVASVSPAVQPESLWGVVEFGTYSGPGLRVHVGEAIRRGKQRLAAWKAQKKK